jgi:hypothetical protein
MSFNLVTSSGEGIYEPTPADMQAALAELGSTDPRDSQSDCYLIHEESGWTLAAFRSGLLVWDNYNESVGAPRHLRTTHAHVLKLWQALAAGRIAEIDALAWQPGAGQ